MGLISVNGLLYIGWYHRNSKNNVLRNSFVDFFTFRNKMEMEESVEFDRTLDEVRLCYAMKR